MKRTSKKAQDIAWDILGKPANMIYKKKCSCCKKRDEKLDEESTSLPSRSARRG